VQEVVFRQPGPLGLGFEFQFQAAEDGACVCTIAEVRPQTQASAHPQLRSGLRLTRSKIMGLIIIRAD
jgi:hypothetical protein